MGILRWRSGVFELLHALGFFVLNLTRGLGFDFDLDISLDLGLDTILCVDLLGERLNSFLPGSNVLVRMRRRGPSREPISCLSCLSCLSRLAAMRAERVTGGVSEIFDTDPDPDSDVGPRSGERDPWLEADPASDPPDANCNGNPNGDNDIDAYRYPYLYPHPDRDAAFLERRRTRELRLNFTLLDSSGSASTSPSLLPPAQPAPSPPRIPLKTTLRTVTFRSLERMGLELDLSLFSQSFGAEREMDSDLDPDLGPLDPKPDHPLPLTLPAPPGLVLDFFRFLLGLALCLPWGGLGSVVFFGCILVMGFSVAFLRLLAFVLWRICCWVIKNRRFLYGLRGLPHDPQYELYV
mmetsp:Transcript_15570/g.24661  ORF Transcript_15570/g.24661 Transcript_15570/m.24661 type:complete len:351 (-) Transcript_15570:109-1161(-)